jgi:hypothetical protein
MKRRTEDERFIARTSDHARLLLPRILWFGSKGKDECGKCAGHQG